MTSRPDSVPRHWNQFLRDMILFCENVMRYTDGLDREGFQASGPVYHATLWNIALIGEAINHIPVAVRDSGTVIPWRDIVDTRNRLIHHYFGIDNTYLWDTITVDIPALLPQLRSLLENAGEPG